MSSMSMPLLPGEMAIKVFVGQVRVVVFGWRRFPAAVQRIAGPLAVVVHVGLQRERSPLPSGNMPFTCLTL